VRPSLLHTQHLPLGSDSYRILANSRKSGFQQPRIRDTKQCDQKSMSLCVVGEDAHLDELIFLSDCHG
jgi:hypothetical protein